jgi:hypothetical protein
MRTDRYLFLGLAFLIVFASPSAEGGCDEKESPKKIKCVTTAVGRAPTPEDGWSCTGFNLEGASADYRASELDPKKWTDLQKEVGSLLDALACVDSNKGWSANMDRFSIVFVDGKAKPEPAVVRVSYPSTPAEMNSTPLPGVDIIWQIFLSDEESAELTSSWSVVRQPNPIESQISDFAVKLVSPLSTIPIRGLDAEKTISVKIVKVPLRFRRAQVSVKDVVAVRTQPGPGELKAASAKLFKELKAGPGYFSECAKTLATALAAGIKASGNAAKPQELLEGIEKTYADTWHSTDCTPAREDNSPLEIDAIRTVRSKFLDVVSRTTTASTTAYKGDSKLVNEPLTHWSLGLTVAASVRGVMNERVKVDSGKIADDAVNGLTLAVVRWHLLGYNRLKDEPGVFEEGPHVFFGGVLTPDPGLAVGVGHGIYRGLTLDAGFALTISKVLREGETRGSAPVSDSQKLKRSGLGTLFVGLGYRFK